MPEQTTPQEQHGAVPDEAVAPLMRGVAVLRALTAAGGTESLSGLERATGLARATVDRITATFARMGYVRLDGRDATLTPRVMELGNAYLAALRLPALLSARADALADELDESVSLAVADRDGIRFIHQATRRRAMSLSFRIGDLLPAERTAPGPLFATEWTDTDWSHWRRRRAMDPRDMGFPAVPPRSWAVADAESAGRAGRAAVASVAEDATAGGEFVRRAGRAVGISTADDEYVRRAGRTAEAPAAEEAFARRAGRAAASAAEDATADEAFVRWARRAAVDGYAVDDQLIEPGLVAVSVPVREPGSGGRIACVASVVSHTSRHTADELRGTLLPRLREAVATMEDDLRATPPAEPGPPPAGLALWTGASKQELGREFVESLARGLTVLTAFGEGRAALTLTEVAKATGLARATARRALITHEYLGLVAGAPGGRFTLTPRVLGLGFPPLSRTTLPRIAHPHLAALTERIGESASLAVLTESGDEIQYTARAAARHVMSVDFPVGSRRPARATSAGRVLLGLVAEAFLDAEPEEGLRSLAVPVRDRTGRVVAALNTAAHAARRTPEECVRDLLPELTTTAHAIESDLRTAGRFTRVALL